MIDLTPLEVRKKKGDFRRALRGYEPALVDDFLDIVADRLEQLVRENATLSERVGRLEHQVTDYRDRERALTDALVTAQAMREEITERTTREAEALKRSAQQQVESQLRDAEAAAGSKVRDAQQRAEDQLRRAQQDAEAKLRQAEQEASARVKQAEQEAYRLRAEAVRTRDQEEEALRRLRARQQQLVKSYRAFLQRELTELNGIADSLQLTAAEEGPEAAEAPPASTAAATPPPEPAAPPPPAAAAAAAAAVLAEAIAAEEEEPFAPEPVYEEDLEEARLTREAPSTLLQEAAPEVSPESGEAALDEWPALQMLEEGQEPDFSRPQPNPDALRLPWSEEEEKPPAAPPPSAAAAAASGEPGEAGEAEAETDVLLENAARAGYRLELQDEPELLLDEPVGEEGGGDNWLDSIIEEEK